jgi:hypothetical protein
MELPKVEMAKKNNSFYIPLEVSEWMFVIKLLSLSFIFNKYIIFH